MHKAYFLFLLLCIVACHANKPAHRTDIDAVEKEDNSLKIIIDSETNLVYTENELNDILKRNPVFIEKYPSSPAEAYRSLEDPSVQGNDRFYSEAGEDEFYLLYSYFLAKKNVKHHPRRERLLKLYRYVNSIYGKLQHGGTYFGHQYSRIPAYVEYDLYRLDPGDSAWTYNKMKSLYIDLFKEEVKSKISRDHDIDPAAEKSLLKEVDELAFLITDYTDLMLVRRFQYSNYY
ncbi:hypothetical protein HGH93_01920 [Chitinophaga polysaccharea]|uniref:hypothetical protein n=1 Tax=Chitinophaga TaxID=79328 RepID=UPI0014556F56|nr:MULTISPECIES: hypothetical protein [Chitinophaga]NLR56841.1 hypothetical protein [Chitinophaga polysaccharea]NLU93064.1 hypothetical protein [Chitinophaga sp. Ak27]